MKNNLFLSILGLLVFSSCEKENNATVKKINYYNIIASDQSEYVSYFDIEDTTIQAEGYSSSHTDEYSIQLDLNKDGQLDYKFIVSSKGGNGGYSISTEVMPLNQNQIAIDTFYVLFDRKILCPKILEAGDTINDNLNFQSLDNYYKLSYFTHLVSDDWEDYVEGFWNGETNKYVGIKFISTQQDTLFGWIRIDVVDYSKLTIKDYAFRK